MITSLSFAPGGLFKDQGYSNIAVIVLIFHGFDVLLFMHKEIWKWFAEPLLF